MMDAWAAGRHFIDIADFDGPTLRGILYEAGAIRERREAIRDERPLGGRTLGLIFDKPSTRTRLSFDLGMRELGGETIVMSGNEMQLGRGESVGDTARVLSRFLDIIMIRTLDHETVRELADCATVPVISGLTHRSHPCQIMADVMTFEDHKGPIRGRVIAWSGPYNNVLKSWIEAAARFDFTLRISVPDILGVPDDVIAWIHSEGADVTLVAHPRDAVAGADCVVTDCWVSMGDDDAESRHNHLMPYQVNDALMAAAPDAIFMHCLPAHRGEEVTDAVMDGPQSVVFDEAENRLHAQKGILSWCLSGT